MKVFRTKREMRDHLWRQIGCVSMAALFLCAPMPAQSDVPSLLEKARAAETSGDFSAAEKIYKQVLRLDPGNPEVLKRLGVVEQTELKFNDSITHFKEVLSRDTNYPETNFFLGVSYLGLGDLPNAMQSLQQELRTPKPHPKCRYYLAMAFESAGHMDEAITQFNKALAENPKNPDSLYELARNLAGAFSLEDTTAILTNRLSKIIPFTTCAVSLFDPSRSEFEIVHAIGRDGEKFIKRRLPVSAGITGWVIQNQRPMYNTNPVLDLSYLGPEVAAEYKAIMVIPLVRNSSPLGAIALYSTELASYSSEYIQLMESIAQPVSDSIHNALAFERAQRAAYTDPATGFANMRAFAAHFEREQARTRRGKRSMSLVVATAENLTSAARKGGANEDEFMSLLGGLIKQRLRESDLIARRSASSFVLLLSESGASEALEVLARLHEEIAQHLLLADLSVTLGAASSLDDGDSLNGLISAARQRSLPVRDRITDGITDLSPSLPDPARTPTGSLM